MCSGSKGDDREVVFFSCVKILLMLVCMYTTGTSVKVSVVQTTPKESSGCLTHLESIHPFTQTINMHLGRRSSKYERTVGLHTHPRTHTHTHFSFCASTTTAAPLTRLLQSDRANGCRWLRLAASDLAAISNTRPLVAIQGLISSMFPELSLLCSAAALGLCLCAFLKPNSSSLIGWWVKEDFKLRLQFSRFYFEDYCG